MNRLARPARLAAGLFLGVELLLAPGCLTLARTVARATTSVSYPHEQWEGDPVALATVKSVLVLPFADKAPEPGFDADGFATRLANQLSARGQLRVVYPREALALVETDNAEIRRHNAEYRRRQLLGIRPATERADLLQRADARRGEAVAGEEDRLQEMLDPVHNLDDAIKVGRRLKVDAVVMGLVTDHDPYLRPRVALTLQVVATGNSEAAAAALAELTQWGIPRSANYSRGIIWSRQQNFDSRDGNIGRDVYEHAFIRHTEEHPYDTETYLRSMRMYYDYVSSTLSKGLLDARTAAVAEAEKRALAEAEKRQAEHLAVRKRINDLTTPDPALPDAEQVVATNLYDRRDGGWRPDVYNLDHPNKAGRLYAPPQNFSAQSAADPALTGDQAAPAKPASNYSALGAFDPNAAFGGDSAMAPPAAKQ